MIIKFNIINTTFYIIQSYKIYNFLKNQRYMAPDSYFQDYVEILS